MLLAIQFALRCFKSDGSAITSAEFSQIGSTNNYLVEGLDEEERSVNLIACALTLDSFKGRGASGRFFDTIRGEIDKFTAFLSSINPASFRSFAAIGIQSDLLLSFKIDDNTMEYEIPRSM